VRGSHQFATLDLLRGIAALSVVTMHFDKELGYSLLPHSYLAVDFFFVLSGFVLAHAYEQRLLSYMTGFQFLRIRLIRLYPLYLIGTVIGIAAIMSTGGLGFSTKETLLQVTFALAFLPDPRQGRIYPFDGPAWSLFFELAANTAYAFLILHLTNRRLVFAAIASLSIAAIWFGEINIGYSSINFLGGFLRVGFGFFAGVLIYRLWQASTWRPALPLWCLGMALVLIFAVGQPPTKTPTQGAYDFLAVLIFPLIVYFGASQEPSPLFRPICLWVGGVSYALYITHSFLRDAEEATARTTLGAHLANGAPWTGLLMIAIAIALTAALSAIDPILRRAISARWSVAPQREGQTGASHLAAPIELHAELILFGLETSDSCKTEPRRRFPIQK
jgi:peptidoglycan/LPS O-acetylase OafA/YrhL